MVDVGSRIADARGRAGFTQGELAAVAQLDRSALAKIETGTRGVSALELVRIAEALQVRIEWFVHEAPKPLVSRRSAQEPGTPSPAIDDLVERIARSVEFVAQHDQQFAPLHPHSLPVPKSAHAAEGLASATRELMTVPQTGPLHDLAARSDAIGLLAFSLELGPESADAAMILLASGGVAVVNGNLRTGRRRLALAHEIGHFLVGDDFSMDWRVAEYTDRSRTEALLDRFARALLLPADDIRAQWKDSSAGQRTAAIQIASRYRVDMATLAARLIELRLLGRDEANAVRSTRTTRSDIVELDLVTADELKPSHLPRSYEQAVLRLYAAEVIPEERALDLLLDTWDDDLPPLNERNESQIWEYV